MKITMKWLEERGACLEGKDWFVKQKETNGVKLVKKLMRGHHADWANWLIVRILERKQYLAYAIYAAEQVLDIFERKYSSDKRPRLAIEAAKKCLDSEKNRIADAAAAYAAYAAYAAAADAADDAAAYAAYAAYAAAAAAAADAAADDAAAYAAYDAAAAAAYDAGVAAAYDAAYADDADDADADDAADARKEIQVKILNYGLALLKGKK